MEGFTSSAFTIATICFGATHQIRLLLLTSVTMLPGKREEAETHEHVLADDESGNGRMHQTHISHGSSQTDHEGLIGDGID